MLHEHATTYTPETTVHHEYFSERLVLRYVRECQINWKMSVDIHIKLPSNLPLRA